MGIDNDEQGSCLIDVIRHKFMNIDGYHDDLPEIDRVRQASIEMHTVCQAMLC